MATTMTLLELRTAVRQRADIENSQFITDTELNSYINQSYFELYDLLVQKYGSHYFVSAPYSLTTDGTSEFYPLPTDFYKLVGLSAKFLGAVSQYTPLKHGSFAEMQRYSGVSSQSLLGINDLLYTLTANNIWLAPVPPAGQALRMFYVPKLSTLSSDSDLVDGISGWTEYIICDAAIKCMQKEESDVTVLAAEKSSLIRRIEDAASNRDAAGASRVNETSSRGDGWSW